MRFLLYSLVFAAAGFVPASSIFGPLSQVKRLGRRQAIDPSDIPSQCKDACSAFLQDQAHCGLNPSCLCTSTIRDHGVTCVDCVAGVEPDETGEIQSEVNLLVNECAQFGHPIDPITVTPVSTSPPPPPTSSTSRPTTGTSTSSEHNTSAPPTKTSGGSESSTASSNTKPSSGVTSSSISSGTGASNSAGTSSLSNQTVSNSQASVITNTASTPSPTAPSSATSSNTPSAVVTPPSQNNSAQGRLEVMLIWKTITVSAAVLAAADLTGFI